MQALEFYNTFIQWRRRRGLPEQPAWMDALEQTPWQRWAMGAALLAVVIAFLRKPVTRDDIIWSYSGVRPLFEVGGGRTPE